MAKTKISVYLIKKNTCLEEMLSDNCHPSQEIRGIGSLYYSNSIVKEPSWVSSFFENEIDSTEIKSSSCSAVALIPVQNRMLAITFGTGRYLLSPDAIESRFGLRIVLNIAESHSFRKVDSTSIAGSAGKTIEQLPIRTGLDSFGIDPERDTLDKVVATIEADEEASLLTGTISGGDALSFSTSLTLRQLQPRLIELLELYSSDLYKERYEWIDHIQQVKDHQTIADLKNKTAQLLMSKSNSVWMALPEILPWESIACFRCPGVGDMPDILSEKVIASFRNGFTQYSQLERKMIQAISSTTDMVIKQWPASKCLYGELELNGETYCLNSGNWYRVDKDYVSSINNQYSASKQYTGALPDYNNTSESEYNKEVAENSQSNYLLLDAKTIRHGGGKSQIEVCDLLSNDDAFIHVKRYSGSATLSHLFNQGLVSARLIKTDSEFVDKANHLLENEFGEHSRQLSSSQSFKVVYAIISKESSTPPRIPFFSRITFVAAAKELKAMGISPEICTIVDRTQLSASD